MKISTFAFAQFCAAVLLLATGCQSSADKAKPQAAQKTGNPAANGVITTASGLRYKMLTSGPAGGKSPTITDSVTVHYRGTLTNGTQFDSSYDRGQPATFGVNQVIPGWTEALQLMKPGDEFALYIPSHLGYGPQSMGNIPANSDLVFQVHLLQVNGAP
jgi:FKBP-type peptidyl-prolyl cis-trans isomerase FklB